MMLPSPGRRREAPRDPDVQAQACHPGPLHSCLGALGSVAPVARGFTSTLAPVSIPQKGNTGSQMEPEQAAGDPPIPWQRAAVSPNTFHFSRLSQPFARRLSSPCSLSVVDACLCPECSLICLQAATLNSPV